MSFVKTFEEVTFGSADIYIGGNTGGYVHGAVKTSFEYEIEDFKTGTPKHIHGRITTEQRANVVVPMAQLNESNLSIALGGITPVDSPGSLVDLSVSGEELTFVSNGRGMEEIKLGASSRRHRAVAVSSGDDAPVVKNSTETVTYTANDDYFLDPTTGYITRNPQGDISSGETVKVFYKYTPSASSRIPFGAHSSIQTYEIEVVHRFPHTGKYMIIHFWKGAPSGKHEIEFGEGWVVPSITFESIEDTGHPTEPLGYVEFSDSL